ncbi:MAG: DUF5916 domain-containing protein [Acidobacteriota bacterium]
MTHRGFGLCLCLSILCPGAERPKLAIPKTSRAPRLQEYLPGGNPSVGALVSGFRQRKPGDGEPVTQETSAWLSYDDRNLYVIFVCKDEPGQVRARMSKREDIDSDDSVALILDTFHDRQRAYAFASNPLGIQGDAIFTEGQGAPDPSFDTLWYSEGRLTPDGYVVWMAIPFKSLRFRDRPGQSWGIGLGRAIVRRNEFSTWPYMTLRMESFLQQLADLEGFDGISSGRNLQFIPYAAFAHARFLDPQAPAIRKETDSRAGLDAKAVLRDALTFDVTLNPDFSQVESDEPQVTVNRRFEVFFPERRPFFIENAGFFETPITTGGAFRPSPRLFFSRRIVNPRFGARMTGKVGGWVLGALVTDDRPPPGAPAPSDPPQANRAAIGVARARRDFAGQSSVGLLVTSRDFASGSNRVFSFDTRLRLNPNWILSGQALRSYTTGQDGKRLSGPAYYASLEHTGRHFQYFSRYLDFSPGFRSELGFIPRVDIRTAQHYASYSWRPEGRRVLSFGAGAKALLNWDHTGRLQDWLYGAGFDLELSGQTNIFAGHDEAFEVFQGRGFRRNVAAGGFRTEWLKWLSIDGGGEREVTVNYFPAAGLAPFSASSIAADAGVTLRPAPRIRFGQKYVYSRLETRQGTSIFNNHIFRSKLNYQFTRPLSIRAILDYNAVVRNEQLVALAHAKRLTADILVTYLVNPGTALYVGYTDLYENLDIDRTMGPVLIRTASPSRSTGRQFFLKLSYLFRF